MRLTLVIHSMSNGGAERVVATMANAWVARGWTITLLTFDDGREPSFYPLDPRVDHRPLGVAAASAGMRQAIRSNLDRIRLIRKAIVDSRPDVIASFLDMVNVRVLAATQGLGIPTIVMEQTDPGQKHLGASWNVLRRLLYPRASRLVVLSETSKSFFGPAIQKRALIIPNPIAIDSPTPAEARFVKAGRTLIAMGRFAPEKGFDLLLDAFSRIEASHPDWQLLIWGDGPLRPTLEAQVAKLSLTNRVSMPGRTTKPFAELRKADLFVMSSRREGFPLALGEAMACGLPAVSFDCPSGPREIIRPGVDGLLVPDGDVPALADALDRLMANDEERQRFAVRAVDVNDRFGAARVLGQWESMFDEVLRERAKGRTASPAKTADVVGS